MQESKGYINNIGYEKSIVDDRFNLVYQFRR